jgi:two-component system phosphate regulon response regulator PhoB
LALKPLREPVASLPLVIFEYSKSPYDDWKAQAWGASLVLVAMVLIIRLSTHAYTAWRYPPRGPRRQRSSLIQLKSDNRSFSGTNMHKGTILIIDDEKDLIELVRYNLDKEGYDVISATNGQAGLEITQRHKLDLIVLDLMMPGMEGLEVCRRLRADSRTARIPVIMLTAKATEADRVVGLELGADDYITKPFAPREMVARVKAILRRTAAHAEPEQMIRHGELVIDVVRHEVKYAGKLVDLTATEFRILQYLASKPGRVHSRDDIIDAALNRDANVFDRTIDVHITAIRRKLGKGSDHIETVRGFGYKFRDVAVAQA